MMFQKTYMSRAITRAMAADHPIGDPTGGAAYGEKNDPISAAISIATMIGTAEAAFVGLNIMAGIAFAGAAVSLVGNVTGNKDLMMLGNVAGIIGGLGTFGVFGEAAQGATWGSLGGTTPATPLVSTPSAGTVAPEVTPWGGSTAPSPLAAAEVSAVPTPSYQTAPLTQAQTAPTPASIISSSPVVKAAGGVEPLGTATSAGNLGTATTPYSDIVAASELGNQGGAFNVNVAASDIAGATKAPIQPQTMFEKAMGYGKGALGFIKENPVAAQMAGSTVGKVADWLTGKTDAELEALKAQSALYGARGDQIRYEIELEKQRRANLNAGYTNVNARIGVNPNAGITQPWGQAPGLINAVRTTG